MLTITDKCSLMATSAPCDKACCGIILRTITDTRLRFRFDSDDPSFDQMMAKYFEPSNTLPALTACGCYIYSVQKDESVDIDKSVDGKKKRIR